MNRLLGFRFLSVRRASLAPQVGRLKSFNPAKLEGVITPTTKSFITKEVVIRPESFVREPSHILVEDQEVEYQWCTVPGQNGAVRMAIGLTGPNGAKLLTTDELIVRTESLEDNELDNEEIFEDELVPQDLWSFDEIDPSIPEEQKLAEN